MNFVNMSEYGRSRVPPVSAAAVKKAIESGRLKKSLRKNPKNGRWEVNPEAADKEWDLNTRETPNRSRSKNSPVKPEKNNNKKSEAALAPESDNGALYNARLEYEEMRAAKAKLDYDERMGKLIPVEAVQREWVKVVTAAKTKILAIPSKAKASIPELTLKQIAVIEALAREALEDLSNDSLR